jgi:hypothetical protein
MAGMPLVPRSAASTTRRAVKRRYEMEVIAVVLLVVGG